MQKHEEICWSLKLIFNERRRTQLTYKYTQGPCCARDSTLLLPFNEGRGSDWCWKAEKFEASAKSPQLNRLLTIWLADRVLVVRRCTGRDSTESSFEAEPGKSEQNEEHTEKKV
jgi:hypothetical protein